MQKPKPKPKMLEFELEGQIKRWTIRQENVGGLWFGIFLVLFPVPHFSISLYGLITSAFGPRTESVDLFEVSWLAITLVFSSLFMVIGLKLIWRDILSRNSGLKTVVELTPTKLSCRNPVLNEVAAAVNVDLDLIRQLILLESLEDLEDKENDAVKNDLKSQNEKAAIVVRGPQTNCTLIQGFPHYLLQMLASQLVIAITKMHISCNCKRSSKG